IRSFQQYEGLMRFDHLSPGQQNNEIMRLLQKVHEEIHLLHRVVDRKLGLTVQQLDAVLEHGAAIMANQDALRAQLDAIAADVADESTVIASVETLLGNLAKAISDLKDELKNTDVPQDIVDKITALGTAVDTNKARLAKDVVDNTPVG